MTLYPVFYRPEGQLQQEECVFRTEVREIAEQFLRLPDSFIPRFREEAHRLFLKTQTDLGYWRDATA